MFDLSLFFRSFDSAILNKSFNYGSAEIPTMAHLLLLFGASSGAPPPLPNPRLSSPPSKSIGHIFSSRLIFLTSTGLSTSVLLMTRNAHIVFLFPFHCWGCVRRTEDRPSQSSLANLTPARDLTKLSSQNQVPKKSK